MVSVEIIGGLGNQMFQYAIGRRLSLEKNTEMKLDISLFSTYDIHKYGLNNFNIVENYCNNNEIEEFQLLKIKHPLRKIYRSLLWKLENKETSGFVLIKEKKSHYDDNIFNNLQSNVYLSGYWQSEKNFKSIEYILREEFKPRFPLSFKSNVVRKNVNDTESVSIHIRRGDYITNLEANAVHGVLPLDYYHKAISLIEEKINNPFYYIFSDDPEWVKQNLQMDQKCYYVTHNGSERAYEDMHLMSQCKHNIIANSTFSWWGAWLNNNPNKIIIAPHRWFSNNKVNTRDLIPDSWMRL